MPSGPAALTATGGRGHTLLVVVGALLAVAGFLAYALAPQGPGQILYAVAAAAFITAIGVGPIARRVRPRRVWFAEGLGALCFLASLVTQAFESGAGPLRYLDIFYFAGYAFLIVWVGLLTVHIGRGTDIDTVLDATAITVGALLAIWTGGLVPLADGSPLPVGVVLTIYPAVDLTLLAMSIYLAYRLSTRVRALDWLLAALSLLLLLDLTFAFFHLFAPQYVPQVQACFLFSYFGMAVAATHPSVPELSRRPVRDNPPRRPTALIVFTISPAILATAVPLNGGVDVATRTGLVIVLLGLLFVRLSRTMGALTRAEEDSRWRATHDELTGLLNRAAIFDVLARRLNIDAARDRTTAVLFLDCDDFKHVNDTWGHHAGDTLLRDIAARLPRHIGARDVLARYGGDEFVVVTSLEDPVQVTRLVARMQAFFDEPRRIQPGRRHAITASVGVAFGARDDGATPEELLRRADIAMYEAKARGRGRCVAFDEELAQRTEVRTSIGERIGAAVANDAFHINLQPIMGGAGFRTLVGWEALARWRDPDLGDVPPDVFIPLAEEFGLIGELGEIVLRQACHDLVLLRAARPEDGLWVSVNVAPPQLLQPDFPRVVQDALASAGLDPEALHLEVTETLLLDRGTVVIDTLNAIRKTGVQVCIDDFGTGYASLTTLLQLPVDCVKTDRSLLVRAAEDPHAFRQLGAVFDLVRSLGVEDIVAEGVETPEHERALRELGCSMVQGWLYGRPVPTATALGALVRATG